MFSGIWMEYLYFKQNTNYAFGLEVFNVRKRDYDWGFSFRLKNTNCYFKLFLQKL